MCSLTWVISECRKPSTSLSDSARSSRENAAIAGLTAVSVVGRRNRLGGKRSSVPRRTPPAIVGGPAPPADGGGGVGERAMRHHMGGVAEGVLRDVEAGVGRDVD